MRRAFFIEQKERAMTRDTIGYDETTNGEVGETQAAPPLCLVHYFAERSAYPPEREPHPPGRRRQGRVVARRENLIILEFAEPPPPDKRWHGRPRRKGGLARACDLLLLLLLLASVGACLAAFRF